MVDKLLDINPNFLGVQFRTIKGVRATIVNDSKENPNSQPYKNNQSLQKGKDDSDSFTQVIDLNTYNEYDLDLSKLNTNEIVSLYDKELKIVDIIRKDGKFIVRGYTDKQINLYGAIDSKDVLIDSKGSVLVYANIAADNLNVIASSVAFVSEVTCSEAIICKCDQGIGFFSDVKADSLSIDAAYIYHESNIVINKQYSAVTHVFQQYQDTTITTRSLSIASRQCELYGNITISDGKFFLVSDNLYFGKPDQTSTFIVKGEHFIRAGNCAINGDTEVLVLNNNKENLTQIIIENKILVSKTSIFDIENTVINGEALIVNGEFTSRNSILEFDRFNQLGNLLLKDSTLTVYDRYTQFEHAYAEVDYSDLSINQAVIYSDFNIEKSVYTGDTFNMYSGSLNVSDCSSFKILADMLVDKSVDTKLKKGKLSVNAGLFLNSDVCANEMTFDVGFFSSNSENINLTDTEIKFKNSCVFSKGLKSLNTRINGDCLTLSGKLTLDELRLIVRSVSINSHNALVDHCIADVEHLYLNSSAEKGQFLIDNSNFILKLLNQSGDVNINKTQLFSIEPGLSHSITSDMVLTSSLFFSESQINTMKGSNLQLHGYTTLQAKSIWNESKLDVFNSSLSTGTVLQSEAELSVTNSSVAIKENLVSSSSKLKVHDRSAITATSLYQDSSKIDIKNSSTLALSDILVSIEEGEISSEDSSVITRRFVSLSPVELKKSVLKSEEIDIFDRMTVQDKSIVAADKVILLRSMADSLINNSNIHADDVQVDGKIEAINSGISAKTIVSMGITSEVSLEGSTTVTSKKDIKINGKLAVKTIKDESDNTLIPSIGATNSINFSGFNQTSGDDLILSGKTITQAGELNLTSSLIAKGGSFNNYGNTSASTMFLGFDRWVFNSGSLSADSLTVHSSLMNFGGQVYAKQHLSVSGLFSLNLGVIAANNSDYNCLLSFNAGLKLPNITADYKYILSNQNLTSFARSSLSVLMPGMSNAINFGFMLPTLYNTATMLASMDLDRIFSMRFHEVMPMLCQLKSAALSGYGAFNTINSGYHDFLNGEHSFIPKDLSHLTNMSLKSIINKTAGIFGGSENENSFLSLNLGGNFALNSNFTDLWHVNVGVEQSA